jgi:hypothetical protein
VLQLAVHEIGAAETTVCGALYIVAFIVAAALTQLAACISALYALLVVGALLLAQLVLCCRLLGVREPSARGELCCRLLAQREPMAASASTTAGDLLDVRSE